MSKKQQVRPRKRSPELEPEQYQTDRPDCYDAKQWRAILSCAEDVPPAKRNEYIENLIDIAKSYNEQRHLHSEFMRLDFGKESKRLRDLARSISEAVESSPKEARFISTLVQQGISDA